MSLKKLNDAQLIESTHQALQTSREAEVMVLRHFQEIEERRLWVDAGSIYKYIAKTFDLTDDQIYPRLQAMRLIITIPEVEQKLESGTLIVTNLLKAQQVFKSEAKKHKVSLEEKRSVLQSLENKSTRKADQILAEKYPASHKAQEKVKPIAPNRNLIQFYVDDQTLADIEDLKARYSHQMPEGRMEDLMKILINIAKRKPEPRKKTKKNPYKESTSNNDEFKSGPSTPRESCDQSSYKSEDLPINSPNRGETKSQAAAPSNQDSSISAKPRARSRHISAEVKRKMEPSRAHGCAHTGAYGQRCGSHHFLQLDHIHEYSKGGSNESDNLRWLCGFHNRNRNQNRGETGGSLRH